METRWSLMRSRSSRSTAKNGSLRAWRRRTAEPNKTAEVDRAGITVLQSCESLQPARQLSRIVRRQDGMVDLASPSWGRILRVGLLLCAAVAINCSGGGDVEVENPCFFSTGGPDNSGSQKICAVAGEQTVED